MMRIGQGYDVHRLAEGRPLILGGVRIEWEKGLEGHSDADVLIHAICDALLGAAGLGDIGQHFPPTNDQYKNADSRSFLRHIRTILESRGYQIQNIDSTIIAEQPRMSPHINSMVENIASDLGLDSHCVNVKATTTEGLGFAGKGQGIAATAIALLESDIVG